MLAIGPDKETVGEWAAAGRTFPELPAMRRYRLARVREQLVKRDCTGVLL
ncbi:hypothetical protein PQR68_28385 [Paraburkholderia agricolaris]